MNGWRELGKKYELKVHIGGMEPMGQEPLPYLEIQLECSFILMAQLLESQWQF